MSTRVLILGVNGFVGGWLVRELCACGWEVLGADMQSKPRYSGIRQYWTCDILDADGIKQIIHQSECEALINLAAITSVAQSWKNPSQTIDVNVVGTLNMLDAAHQLKNPPRILLVGSSEEYAPSLTPLTENSPLDANNPYGISKMTQEHLAKLYADTWNLDVCFTRSFNHTGPGQSSAFVLSSWCYQVAAIQRSGKPGVLRVGNLNVARDFTDVRDITRAYRMIIEAHLKNEVFNVGSGKAYPLSDLAQTIASFAQVPVSIEIDETLVRTVDNPVICCNFGHLQSLTGWQPKFAIEDTLKELYESFFR